MADTIGFLDSGVGGLPYLATARRALPGARFVHVADRANFPYGEKAEQDIIAASLGVAERLIRAVSPRLIVVACNTISVVGLSALRSRFPVPFVGVVPAVKPAAALSPHRRVGVLATRQTVEGAYLKGLIESYAAGCAVTSLPSADLVAFVERDLATASVEEKAARVRREVERFREARIDSLVLACTHYLHLEAEFKSQLEAEGIALVDSREGVVRQICRLLGPVPGNGDSPRDDLLYVTGTDPLEERYAWFARSFGLRLAGTL